MDPRKMWHNIVEVLKEQSGQSKILYPMKIFSGYEGRIKTFSDEGKWRLYCQQIYPKGIIKVL